MKRRLYNQNEFMNDNFGIGSFTLIKELFLQSNVDEDLKERMEWFDK